VFIYEIADAEPQALSRTPDRRWHAVAIVPTPTACAAAQACKDKRFLSAEAPRLPLKGCDAARCDCRYGHFDDRRRGPRRGASKGVPKPKPTGPEQRTRLGRRKSDGADD
jgi:hypothetical protein